MKNIKQYVSVFILLSILNIILTSCTDTEIINENENNYINFTTTENDFTYKHNEGNIFSYYVDYDGIFYYFTNEYEAEENTARESKLFTVDLDGNIINETSIEYDYFLKMVVANNTLYYTPEFTKGIKICSADLETNELNTVCIIDDFIEMKKMVVVDDILYFMGIEKNATGRDYTLFNHSDDFFYYGDIIRTLNLKTGEINDFFTDLLINFSEMPNGNLMIYAYDENAGYYFQEYNVKLNSFGEKIYKTYDPRSNKISDFTITNNNEIIFKNLTVLKISDLNNAESITEIAKNASVFATNTLYRSGYLFYFTEEGVRRIHLSKFFRSPVVLNMGYVYKGMDFPNNNGFFVNNKELNFDEFALSVLSGDSDIDFYLINSLHNFTDNIRNKGAYYRLNDIPGVMEYLDACFPYVKDAAINENGDVWMIPYSLGTFSVDYNQKVWERYGLDIKSYKTLNELIDTLYYFNENNIDESYLINSNEIIFKYFYQLIEKNKGFNKDEFKQMAEYSYEKLNFVKDHIPEYIYGVLLNKTTKTDIDSITGGIFNGYVVNGAVQYGTLHKVDTMLLDNISRFPDFDDYNKAKSDSTRTFFSIRQYINLRSTALPSIEGFEKNDMTCEFFYVNPNSDNLDLVLEYISEYCKETMNKRNTFILQDKSTYDDRVYINDFYDIYNSDSYVRFGLSEELFFEDFVKYLGDEITLDEYLNRIEYKINAYLNE